MALTAYWVIIFQGYCHIATALRKLGLADENPHPALHEDAPEITWVSESTLLPLPNPTHGPISIP